MSGLLHSKTMYYSLTYYMQQFSLVYNNLFVILEPVDEPRLTYDCGQLMQGSSSPITSALAVNYLSLASGVFAKYFIV